MTTKQRAFQCLIGVSDSLSFSSDVWMFISSFAQFTHSFPLISFNYTIHSWLIMATLDKWLIKRPKLDPSGDGAGHSRQVNLEEPIVRKSNHVAKAVEVMEVSDDDDDVSIVGEVKVAAKAAKETPRKYSDVLVQSPKAITVASKDVKPDLTAIHRFKVKDVEINFGSREKLLTMSSDLNPIEYKARLTGTWFETVVESCDEINIKCDRFSTESMEFLINDSSGFIVVNPDNMIPCTSVTSSFFCQRKSWLNEKFKGWGPSTNNFMLVGCLVHELLQNICVEKTYEFKAIQTKLRQMVKSSPFKFQALECNMTEKDLLREAEKYLPHILSFVDMYITGGPSPLHDDDPQKKMKIIKVHDIEDNIWCHYVGLKGKVDFSVEVVINESVKSSQNSRPTRIQRTGVLPLELKTGKPSFSSEHTAQATMYSLMMDNRQHGSCSSGLLLYLKDGPKLKEVKLNPFSKHSIIQRRNEYDRFSRKWNEGPEFKESQHHCSNCEHLLDCSLMAKCFEEEKIEFSEVMPGLVETSTQHLDFEHFKFFTEWVTILNHELMAEKEASNRSQTIDIPFWNESSINREDEGLALGKMVRTLTTNGTIYRFERHHDFRTCFPAVSTTVANWKIRDRVALSADEDQMSQGTKRDMVAIMTGSVYSIDSSYVEVSFDKELQESLLDMTFRIDRLGTSSYGFSVNFSNILRLMIPLDPVCEKLRKCIINTPGNSLSNGHKLPASVPSIAKKVLKDMEKDERKMIIQMLAADPFCLLHERLTSEAKAEGPKALKVKLVTGLVQMLDQMKKSVLIVTQSTDTLDRILLSLKEAKVNLLRFGYGNSKVPEALIGCREEDVASQLETPAQLETFYASHRIFGTVMSRYMSHPFFESRAQPFDYCILDEASNMMLSGFIAPLFKSDQFLLIGKEGKAPNSRSGKPYSLFSHMSQRWPDKLFDCWSINYTFIHTISLYFLLMLSLFFESFDSVLIVVWFSLYLLFAFWNS